MIIFNKFRLNIKENSSFKSIYRLRNFINQYVKKKDFNFIFSEISKCIDLDKEVCDLKAKKILYNNFSFEKNKFNNFSKLNNIIYHFLAFFFIFFKALISKKSINREKKKIIFFDIETVDEIIKFKNILKYFNRSVLITSKNIDFKKKKNFHDKYLKNNLNINYKNNRIDLNFKDNLKENCSFNASILNDRKWNLDKNCIHNKIKILKLVFIILYLSIKNNFNYILFLNIILHSYLKNYSIFKKFDSQILINDRIYLSCPIRNNLFKKNGGILTICVQSHLSEASICMFNDIDYLFTFGRENNSLRLLKSLGSKIKKTFPVGSLRAENYLYNTSKKFHSKKKIDILFIGVNLFNWFYINKNTQNNYYQSYELIKNLSNKYKDLKIFIKHHPNNKQDENELKIFKNTNIKYLKKKDNSYSFIKNTKIFFSFSSTLIQEIHGYSGRSYFLDPCNNNELFFKENKYLQRIKISSFKDLCNIVEKIIYKKNSFFNKKINPKISLDSKNTSKLIINEISKHIN